MEKITVTTYRGLSQVSGSISLPKLFEHMRGEIYRDRVRRIREALTSGDTGKADRMKKQLPYRTVTATYSNERLAYSLETYQDIITLDFDDMEVEKSRNTAGWRTTVPTRWEISSAPASTD